MNSSHSLRSMRIGAMRMVPIIWSSTTAHIHASQDADCRTILEDSDEDWVRWNPEGTEVFIKNLAKVSLHPYELTLYIWVHAGP